MSTLLRTITTVLSAFVGIRRRADHEAAQPKIKLVHIVVTALLMALLIIIGLVFLVKTIAAHAG